MMEIAPLTKERAKEFGVELRMKENGPNEVWVELEFKAVGSLKDFIRVSLEISDGEKFLLGYSALKETRSPSGSISVQFLANRAFLDKLTLSIVTGFPTAELGYDLRLKDFVEPAKAK